MTDNAINPLDGLMSTAEAAKFIGVKPDALTRAITRFPEYAPGKIGGAYIWTGEQASLVKLVAERIAEHRCPHCGKDLKGESKQAPVRPEPEPETKPEDNGGTQ